MAERTLIIIKPDTIQRHLAGEIISRFEKKGLKLVAAKFIQISQDSARKLYEVHKDKPFYETVKNYKRYVIEDALKKSSGNQSKAARLLGLQRTYLARLIRQLNISVKD